MNSLTIEKTVSIFDKFATLEHISLSILDKLIKSDLLQTQKYTFGPESHEFENEKEFLQNIRRGIKKDKLKVTYQTAKSGYGRVYANKSLSLCCVRKEVRHALCRDYYADIDVENCHPVMLQHLCQSNGLACTYLTNYVNNRNAFLTEVMTVNNIDRDQAKSLFIRLLYFGSFQAWASDNNLPNAVETEFVKNFAKELKNIGSNIYNTNKTIEKAILKSKKEIVNITASVVSTVLQEYERRVLEVVYTYLKGRFDLTDCVLIYDGLMINKNSYNDELLDELSNVVFDTLGVRLRFTQKEMGTEYLDHINNNEIDLEPTSYAYMKREFELTHCKIVSKGIYINHKDNIQFLTRKQLADNYEHLSYVDDNGRKESFVNEWTRDETIRKYEDMNVYPKASDCPDTTFNLWVKFNSDLETPYTSNPQALTEILNLIRILCGNDDKVYKYICGWVGQMIQYPETKTIVPTLISKQGAGKGTFLKLLSNMMGQSKVTETTTPDRDVWGNFNSIMIDSFLINLNELSKKDTIEAEGRIKGLVTDSTLTVNRKGADQFRIKSFHRFIITTNKEDPINTSNDDRRNLIIRSSDELIGNKAYFKMIYKLLEDTNVIRTCYDYFKSIPNLDRFTEQPIPMTQYQTNLKKMNISAPEQFISSFIETYAGQDIIKLSAKQTFDSFQMFIAENNIEYQTSNLKFGIKLTNLNIPGVDKGRAKTGIMYTFDIAKIKDYFEPEEVEDTFISESEPEVTIPEPVIMVEAIVSKPKITKHMKPVSKVDTSKFDLFGSDNED